MKRSEWIKTPYAGSRAEGTDESIARLFSRYGISEHQITQQRGPNGRPAYVIRFMLKDRMYRVGVECLDCPDAGPDELIIQAKRAVFHFLKSMLEMQTVFFSAEQVLFSFLELPGSQCTMYEAAAPKLAGMTVAKVSNLFLPQGGMEK